MKNTPEPPIAAPAADKKSEAAPHSTQPETCAEQAQSLPPATNTAEKQAENTEHGGRGGLDPARFGDWEIKGKCVDF